MNYIFAIGGAGKSQSSYLNSIIKRNLSFLHLQPRQYNTFVICDVSKNHDSYLNRIIKRMVSFSRLQTRHNNTLIRKHIFDVLNFKFQRTTNNPLHLESMNFYNCDIFKEHNNLLNCSMLNNTTLITHIKSLLKDTTELTYMNFLDKHDKQNYLPNDSIVKSIFDNLCVKLCIVKFTPCFHKNVLSNLKQSYILTPRLNY